ncbi:5'-nucleotidase [uncultured Bacteroides sp.]|uniref:5'-nucleotidase n=1 Tax=uncultured Bacteroides sp. TaxID=162156 RepID=UPI00280B7875|nr:5'-nucleotidase [uncultured Bacteroides sp.]
MKNLQIIIILLIGGLSLSAQKRTIIWTMDPVDGHRTGVVASNASNVEEAMGTVKGHTYYAPNGKKFRKGTVKDAARIMLDAQPTMAKVKTVIGHSTRAMVRTYPECEIYDWYIDELMRATADSTGKRVDIGFANRGGVRIDMPAGEVLYDDIMSMFPFRNNLCYVALRGRDVKVILDQMASTTFQIVGGIKVVAKNGKVVSATINGEPLDDDKLYGIATLNFMLDGGDGYKVGKNAEDVIRCNGYLYDTMLAYVQSLTAAGKPIESQNQHWITILGEGDNK